MSRVPAIAGCRAGRSASGLTAAISATCALVDWHHRDRQVSSATIRLMVFGTMRSSIGSNMLGFGRAAHGQRVLPVTVTSSARVVPFQP